MERYGKKSAGRQFDQQVLPSYPLFAMSTPPLQGQVADNGNILVPRQLLIAVRAMGPTEHRLLSPKTMNQAIQKRADDQTEDKNEKNHEPRNAE